MKKSKLCRRNKKMIKRKQNNYLNNQIKMLQKNIYTQLCKLHMGVRKFLIKSSSLSNYNKKKSQTKNKNKIKELKNN